LIRTRAPSVAGRVLPGGALFIDAAFAAGHLTESELREQQAIARFVYKTRGMA
jgi:hypothetical protein